MISPWFRCAACHACSSDPKDSDVCFSCGANAVAEMREIQVAPEMRVSVLHAAFTNPMQTDRRAKWDQTNIYAARNPHACTNEHCECVWVLWPEDDPEDWIIVGRECFVKIDGVKTAGIKGPVFHVDP